MTTDKLQKYLDEYAESHQNKTNQFIHQFAVPVVMFSFLGLLKAVPVPESWPLWLDWSYIVIFCAICFYASLRNLKLFLLISLLLATQVTLLEVLRPHFFILCFFLFIIAWIAQFIGHKIEGKKPAFFKDLFFFLIGPLWVIKHLEDKFSSAKDT